MANAFAELDAHASRALITQKLSEFYKHLRIGDVEVKRITGTVLRYVAHLPPSVGYSRPA